MQDVRLISLTPLAGSRSRVATSLARAFGDNELLIMLSGDEGSGKSAILAAVVATLSYGGMRTIRVSNPDGSTMGQRELAARILGRPTMGSPAQLVAEAITNLIASTDGGQVVLVVDDAHTLSDQAMELLLVITSPARLGGSAPQLLLAGRGAFWDRPWREELRMLTDVAEKVFLEPLTAEDAQDFVMAEAASAGGTVSSATPDALNALVHCSLGLCAQMSRIVADAVALANSRQVQVLTADIVDAVVTPDTLLEPPCIEAVAEPLSGGEMPPTVAEPLNGRETLPVVAEVAVPAPVTQPNGAGRWPVLAGVALVVVAGATVGLVPSLRTQVGSLFGGGAPETSSAPATGAAVAPESPKAAQEQPAQPEREAAGSAPTSTTQDAVSSPAGTPQGVGPTPPVETRGEPPTAAQEARTSGAGEQPVGSASEQGTLSDHAAGTTSTTGAVRGGEQQTTSHAAPTDATAEPATATRATETAKRDALPVAPEVPPAVVPPPVATAAPPPAPPPSASPPATPPPVVAALPIAPPPAAVLPGVPPPVFAPSAGNSPPAATSLPAAVVETLLQRGNEKLAMGDVLSARLYFERAGGAGSEEGAIGAAKTYDPGFLATIDAPGLQSDVKRAIDWYRIAVTAHGNSEAQRRIDALTAAGAH